MDWLGFWIPNPNKKCYVWTEQANEILLFLLLDISFANHKDISSLCFLYMQVDDSEVIGFLLQTEIIPLCLRTMEMGSELSKTVWTQPFYNSNDRLVLGSIFLAFDNASSAWLIILVRNLHAETLNRAAT